MTPTERPERFWFTIRQVSPEIGYEVTYMDGIKAVSGRVDMTNGLSRDQAIDHGRTWVAHAIASAASVEVFR